MSKKPMTRKELTEEASRMIRASNPLSVRLHNRPPEEIATVAIDMLGKANMARRELRRKYSLMRNSEMAIHYISTRDVPNPEQLLMEQQYQEQADRALVNLFRHFEDDVVVKRLLLANLRHGIPFHSTKLLAKECDLTEKQVHTAKERIKHLTRKDGKHLSFDQFLSSFKGGI